ncbi:helix-turn-helix transcriptional regulator [Kutzneria sp. CA-103260]|uniref:helix-turn-helix transcriptional regulator n=1 Tax=Kutzneria sp. CA-103260 TaxID=2802641 RepID=UPI001BAA381F|nr:helix-turn-helix transcriptional regulator [Kutzneria sp. CA-103260]QUQ64465.1 XRE family transcriptional regulator [Kutzneria sp. CA-103260]
MARSRDSRSNVVRRKELAAFLRSRRDRITPEQVGLARMGVRRTPGLRREEVAQLAGIGITWYTWLEQGRDITPSEQVLGALATTLRLTQYERDHMFSLARPSDRRPPGAEPAVLTTVWRILDKLEPFPVVVHNGRNDILAYNRGYDWLMDIAAIPPDERNSLYQVVTNPVWQQRMRGWAERLPVAVAEFRTQMSARMAEPGWAELVEMLRRESSTFDRLWEQHNVRPMRNQHKCFAHPVGGTLHFDFTHLWFGQQSDVRVTTYTPSDAETAAALEIYVPSSR